MYAADMHCTGKKAYKYIFNYWLFFFTLTLAVLSADVEEELPEHGRVVLELLIGSPAGAHPFHLALVNALLKLE